MFRATGPGKVDFKDRSVWGVRNDCTALVYNFDVERDKLKDDHRKFLRATIVPRLKAGCGVTIMGLADATGDASYNQALSERRAHELLAFLRIEAGGAFPLRAEVGTRSCATL